MYIKTIIVSTLAVNQIHHQCCSTMWLDITKRHLHNLCRYWYVLYTEKHQGCFNQAWLSQLHAIQGYVGYHELQNV